MTSDGELVVHHDYYLGNPDDGDGRIFERGLAYIQSLRISKTEKIPTLNEVFEFIGNKLEYEIELKGFGKEFFVKVIDMVKKYDLADVIEFTSPHTYMLTKLRTLEQSLKTGLFVSSLPVWMDRELGQKIAIDNALLGEIDILHCPLGVIDGKFIREAHDQKLFVHAADCNTKEDLQVAFAMGVDQVSTNEIELALELR